MEDWGAHGGEGGGGQERSLGRLAAEKTEKVVGSQARGATGQARKPPPTGLREADTEADTALCREAHLKQGTGDLGGSRARGTETTQSREKVVYTWKSTVEYF